jgi:hypothetical protein
MIGAVSVSNAELLKQHPLLARLSFDQVSRRLRDTNGLVGSVERLSEWLAASLV